jgi:tRNA1(Val) A37 N6-methylase TrmN6
MDAVLLAHFARVPKHGRVIDLGTGTGVIALLLSALSTAETIDALEIEPSLAEMGTRSVAMNGLGGRITVRQGDIRRVAELYPAHAFAAVVSNPPYFPVGSGRISPLPARAAGRSELTCTLDDICAAASHLLGRRGRLSFVYRPERLVDAFGICRRRGLEPKRIRFVQPNAASRPGLALIEALPGARPGLITEPVLIIRDGATCSAEVPQTK